MVVVQIEIDRGLSRLIASAELVTSRLAKADKRGIHRTDADTIPRVIVDGDTSVNPNLVVVDVLDRNVGDRMDFLS